MEKRSKILRNLVFAIAIIAGAPVLPSFAQIVATQTRVEMDVPSGAAISVANAVTGNPSTVPVVALITFAIDANDSYQYRAIASDPGNGTVLWSRDLGSACETRLDDYGLVTPLDNGDVIVTAQALDPVDPGTSCVMRLRAADGQVLWSRTLSASGATLAIYALVQDSQGQLLATGRKAGNAFNLRLDGQSGETLWEQEIPAAAGTTLRGFSIATNENSTVIHLLVKGSDGSSSLRLLGVATDSGNERWSLANCAGGQFIAYQRYANDIRLRMLADSTVEFVAACNDGSNATVELGRIQAETGVPVWQRTLATSSLTRAIIAVDGNLLVEGTLTVDGVELGVARLDTTDAHLQWSMPRPIAPPPMAPYTTNRYVIAGAYLHVLELFVELPDYATSATVATYAVDSGQFLGRFDVGFPVDDLVVPKTASIAAFGNGEVVVTALSGANRYVGSRLFETRLNGLGGLPGWSRQTSVMSPFPFKPTARIQTDRLMRLNDKGRSGVLLGGHGINGNNYDYPRAAKIDANDGRVLWRWQQDKGIRGDVAALFSDGEDNAILVGSNGWDNPSLLLSKLDGENGETLWEASGSVSRIALDGTLDGSGNILLLLESTSDDPGARQRVAKRSAFDGASLWEAVIPDSQYSDADERRVLVSPDGSVLVLGPWLTSSSAFGMQVTRLRNTDGTVEWRRKLPGLADSQPALLQALGNGDVIVVSNMRAWRIDGASGTIEWQKALPFPAFSMVLDGQGGIVVGGESANRRALARLDATTGLPLWTRQLPLMVASAFSERISSVEIAVDGKILAANGDGQDKQGLGAFALADGATHWETITASGSLGGGDSFPIAILQSPDGNIYSGSLLGESSSWTVTRITGPFADGIFASGYE
ncbi:MAG: PQQ-binding-like beta-propeller repeat protein [Dokdonella sp.]